MASITMNSVPNQGTMSTTITGNEKFVIIGSNGKPSTVEVNQILNKVDEKVEDALNKTDSTMVNLSVVGDKLIITNVNLSQNNADERRY